MIFWFHFAILVLLGFILGYSTWMKGEKRLLLPLLGLLALFGFHCLFWGSGCTVCNVDSPICLIELVVFWSLTLWALWEKFKENGKIL